MPEAAAYSAHRHSRVTQLFADPALGASRQQVEAGQVLYEPDAPADALRLIESGQVRIYQLGPDNSTRLADILGAGEWFGVSALARASSYGTRAVSVSKTTLWMIPVGTAMHLIEQHPEVAVELIGQLASRLKAAHEAAARLMFDDCNQRLIQTLVRFSHSAAASPQEGGEVVLHITHQQLAQAVGAARETVSLALTQLRQRNLLRTGRNRLFFDPAALQEFCSMRTKEAEQRN